MSVYACKFYKIVFGKDIADKVVRNIAVWGKFEPADPVVQIDTASYTKILDEVKKRKDSYHQVIDYIEKNYLQEKSTKTYLSVDTDKIFKLTVKNFSNYENDLGNLLIKVDELKKKGERLQKFNQKTKPLQLILDKVGAVDFPIFAKHQLFKTRVFVVPDDVKNVFEDKVNKKKGFSAVSINKTDNESYFVIIYPKNKKIAVIDQIIKASNAWEIEIDSNLKEFIPTDLNKVISTKVSDLQTEIKKIESEVLESYEKDRAAFKSVVDILTYENQVAEFCKYVSFYTGSARDEKLANSLMLRQGSLYQIEGWVHPAYKDELKVVLEKVDKTIEIQESKILEKEQERTVLVNNTYIKPFEFITKFMGVPSPQEIDPTPFFSPFFVLFFGFALGDAGYGILMFIVATYFLYKKNIPADYRQVLLLVFYCGISTIFFGAITGSWFGANIANTSGSFGKFLLSLKQFDIQRSIIFVLVASIGIGFIHQIVGLFLNGLVLIKNRRFLDALANPGTWIFFLLALTSKILSGIMGIDGIVLSVINVLLVLSVIFFIIGQGIRTKPVYLIPFIGIAQFFNITSFISNSLSYARLLALGLATGVIASVVNLLAGVFGSTDSFFGIVVYIFVLILGHSVNIALNLLGTFVNVLRLQLVEFFPRFFNAQGVELSPVKLNSDYFNHQAKILDSYADRFSYATVNRIKKI